MLSELPFFLNTDFFKYSLRFESLYFICIVLLAMLWSFHISLLFWFLLPFHYTAFFEVLIVIDLNKY